MQIMDKVLQKSNDFSHFFWVDYMPIWISPIWVYLILWYLIMFLSINWKNSIKVKMSFKNMKWGEDLYFLSFIMMLYIIVMTYQYNMMDHIMTMAIMFFGLCLDMADMYMTYLFEENIELDNKFSILHKFKVLWAEILAYLKK